jgi:hypothetical protein
LLLDSTARDHTADGLTDRGTDMADAARIPDMTGKALAEAVGTFILVF